MVGLSRNPPWDGPAILSAGFRIFFLLAAFWACLAMPAFMAVLVAGATPPSAFAPLVWHVHEMAFGFGGAVVAGFLLTAIPNWTGRAPLHGLPLALLALLWLAGRVALYPILDVGAGPAALFDLSFPVAFVAVILREIVTGRSWRNLPVTVALALLLLGNLLTHLEALDVADTADMGNRIGVATLLMLIALIGGRIVPSFTRNWLVKHEPYAAPPAPFDLADKAALATTFAALSAWALFPGAALTDLLEIAAGGALALRLSRWRGEQTLREPLLVVLHLGYFWLAFGLLLLGLNGLSPLLPQSAAVHALTVGAIGTMTLAVMTRASLGHTGRPLTAGVGTTAIYVSITLAAMLRLVAPLFGDGYVPALSLAATAWSIAYGLFLVLYIGPLATSGISGAETGDKR